MLAPGGFHLLFAFLIPLVIVVYSSLRSGGILDPNGFQFTSRWSNYTGMSPQVNVWRTVLFGAGSTIAVVNLIGSRRAPR